MLNKNNECVDCLNNYEYDPQICNFTREVFLVRCPYESKDLFSSLTIKLWLDDFENYESILDKKVDWGYDFFDIKFEGLDGQQMTEPRSTSRILQKMLSNGIDKKINQRLLEEQLEPVSKRYLVRRQSLVVDLNFTKTLSDKSLMTI